MYNDEYPSVRLSLLWVCVCECVCMHIIELNAFLFVKVESNNSNIQSLIQFHLCNNNTPVGRTDRQAGRGRERTLSDIADSISLRCRAFHTHTRTHTESTLKITWKVFLLTENYYLFIYSFRCSESSGMTESERITAGLCLYPWPLSVVGSVIISVSWGLSNLHYAVASPPSPSSSFLLFLLLLSDCQRWLSFLLTSFFCGEMH